MPVTMSLSVHIRSSWPTPVGPRLTDRRITELQREGWYGSGLKLPPKEDARPCCECESRVNTRYMDYSYLPKPGVYCRVHRLHYKDIRDREREAAKAWKERVIADYL